LWIYYDEYTEFLLLAIAYKCLFKEFDVFIDVFMEESAAV